LLGVVMKQKVSVIIPAYNRAKYIGESIECMLRQTLAPHELIVVDDGSTDNTVAVAKSFGNRVKLISQPNAGPSAARNAALAQATGDFIQFFDSDDLATYEKLAWQTEALIRTGADIAYGPWVQAFFDGDLVHVGRVAHQQGPLGRPALSALLRGWIMFIPACVIRRSLMTAVGGYPMTSHTGDDTVLMFRLAVSGARFVHVRGPMLLVRQHPEGQISTAPEYASMRAIDRLRRISIIESLVACSGEKLSSLDRLIWSSLTWETHYQCTLGDSKAPAVSNNLLHRIILRLWRLRAAIHGRAGGSAFGPLFNGAPLTPSQRAAIRALGYTPVERQAPPEHQASPKAAV
jgi:GT2 family glycosyltransferase